MNSKTSDHFSSRASSASNYSHGFGDVGKQFLSKPDEIKSNNVVPNRRRSRLGTYRASLLFNVNKGLTSSNEEKAKSHKKVPSQKKLVPALPTSTPDSSDKKNNVGAKKCLFTRSPISRRLNMDTSSIIQNNTENSTENQDPDVTGVCFIDGTAQSVKKCPVATNNHDNNYFTDHQNRKYLSSLENNSVRHLGSAKKTSRTSRFSNVFHSKSPFPKSPKINGSKNVKSFTSPIVQFPKFNIGTVKTPPTPPVIVNFRNRMKQVISSPELPKSTADVIAAIRKRSIADLGNNKSSASNPDINLKETSVKGIANNFGMSASTSCSQAVTENDKSVVRENVCSRLFDNEVNYDIDTNINSSSTNCKVTCVKEPVDCAVKNQSLKYDLDNSLEAAYARVNGTYDIIETSFKNIQPASEKASCDSENIVKDNSEKYIPSMKSDDLVSEKQLPSHDRSPSFIVFDKKVNNTYEIDDSTDSFIYNETLCNNKTLKYIDDLDYCGDGEGSTLKKNKKLSMITEETAVSNCPSTSNGIPHGNSSILKINNTFDVSMQITTCQTDIRKNENEIGSTVNDLLLKFCETTKQIEKAYEESRLFFKKQDDLIDNLSKCIQHLNLQKEEFIKNQQSHLTSVFTSLSDLKNKVKNLISLNENNNDNFLNSTVINDALKDAEKIITSARFSVSVTKTPEHGCSTLSKSVYNQLKTEYSCLKTPKPSTVKKNTVSSRKVFTPHSMSLCLQDQVDRLFDDED